MSQHPKEKKDRWDKAAIISGFISSVVIAGVGILINIAIQRAQIKSSEESTRAQIEVSERNNKAQVALTERTAEIQKTLQEGTLTSQLVEHLASGSALKKQLAIVVLRRAIPPEMYQDVITIIVKSDTDPEVRKTALEQARTLRDIAPGVAQAIAQAALDSRRPEDERQLATQAIRQVGVTSIVPEDTFLLSSASEGGVSFEDARLSGSVFTRYLLRGLSGEAAEKKDGDVRLHQLSEFVMTKVKQATAGRQTPIFVSPTTGTDPPIVGKRALYSSVVVVAIGNSRYKDPLMELRFGASDATDFAQFWRNQAASNDSIRTKVVLDATREQTFEALDWSTRSADSDSLEIIYYSGHALTTIEGTSWLLPVDTDLKNLRQNGVSTEEIRTYLRKSPARTRVVFIDAAFSQAVVPNR
jgi:hypothetical protein